MAYYSNEHKARSEQLFLTRKSCCQYSRLCTMIVQFLHKIPPTTGYYRVGPRTCTAWKRVRALASVGMSSFFCFVRYRDWLYRCHHSAGRAVSP